MYENGGVGSDEFNRAIGDGTIFVADESNPHDELDHVPGLGVLGNSPVWLDTRSLMHRLYVARDATEPGSERSEKIQRLIDKLSDVWVENFSQTLTNGFFGGFVSSTWEDQYRDGVRGLEEKFESLLSETVGFPR